MTEHSYSAVPEPKFVVINLGRNIGDHGPMHANRWELFQHRAAQDVRGSGGNIVGHGSGCSVWDHEPEEFVTLHALVPEHELQTLRRALARTAAQFQQAAIACMVSDDSSLVYAYGARNSEERAA